MTTSFMGSASLGSSLSLQTRVTDEAHVCGGASPLPMESLAAVQAQGDSVRQAASTGLFWAALSYQSCPLGVRYIQFPSIRSICFSIWQRDLPKVTLISGKYTVLGAN